MEPATLEPYRFVTDIKALLRKEKGGSEFRGGNQQVFTTYFEGKLE